MRDVLCILLLASTVCDSRTVLPRNYKSFSLTSRCDNVSDTAASAFDGAYRRGWSGGQKSTASFKAYVSQSVSYYYKNPTDRESASGMGSNLGPPTAGSLQILRHTIQNYDVHTMVDVPCGDVNWQFGEWAVDSLHKRTLGSTSSQSSLSSTNVGLPSIQTRTSLSGTFRNAKCHTWNSPWSLARS